MRGCRGLPIKRQRQSFGTSPQRDARQFWRLRACRRRRLRDAHSCRAGLSGLFPANRSDPLFIAYRRRQVLAKTGHHPREGDGSRTEGDETMKPTYAPFDPADYLDNDEVIAEYLSAAVEDPDPNVFLAALGDAAKARGMAQIAKDAGLGRESLYKALSTGAHPRYETVAAVLHALGMRFTFVAERP